MKRNTFILIILILLAQCKKKQAPNCYIDLPAGIFFQIKKNGQILSNDILNNLKLSYIQNGAKNYVSDLSQAVDNYANKGIMATRLVGVYSANQNIKTFYLEYANGFSTDTLYIDYIAPTPDNNCLYILQQLKYNNEVPTIDSSFTDEPVYSFIKQ